MARLRSIAPESFSPRDHLSPAGLGSILRDQKLFSFTNRAHVLLGLTHTPAQSVSKSPVRSIASSPVESTFLDAEELDEFKEEDVWAAETRSWQEVPKGKELGKSDLSLGLSDIAKRVNDLELLRPSRRRIDKGPGLTDALANGGAMGLSPLSRMAEIAQASNHQTPARLSTASRAIPQFGAVNDYRRYAEHQSAPVNVPDWSKILGSEMASKPNGIVDEDGDEDDERLPPHELVAKDYARSQRTTFSVCEGQGRTLKGRDLSRVRNAVWSQIGFAD